MAKQMGGRAFFPLRVNELPDVHGLIATETYSRYVLTYTPTNQEMNGAYRSIRLAVSGPDYTVKARPGYFAPSARRRFARRWSSASPVTAQRPARCRPTDLTRARRRGAADDRVVPGSQRADVDRDGDRRQRQHAPRARRGEGRGARRSSKRSGRPTRWRSCSSRTACVVAHELDHEAPADAGWHCLASGAGWHGAVGRAVRFDGVPESAARPPRRGRAHRRP